MKCNNFFRGLVLFLTLLITNTFAQSYVAIAHVIYDGNSLYYADNEKDLKYQRLTKGDDDMFTVTFKNERLAAGKGNVRRLRFGLGCNGSSCSKNLNETDMPTLAELFPNYKDGGSGYEVWIIINDDGTLTKSSTPLAIPPSQKKVIRFFAPWNNTNAIMYMSGSDEVTMSSVPNYCGWFEARVKLPKDDEFTVFFKQTIGGTFVGNEGPTKDSISIENEISLDSVVKNSDTVWVYAYQFGAPDIYTKFPELLGDCPIKNLPVMMFDWYDGSVNSDGTEDGSEWPRNKPAGRNGFDVRGVPMFGKGTSEDFGQKGCEGSPMTGMVDKELGPNGVPVRSATNFPKYCTNATHLDNWFLPEVIGKDAAGKEYTNVTCRELELSLTDDGFWFAQIDNSSPEGGLFFLDDFRYLDSAHTVENIYYDSLPGIEVKGVRGFHNFGFTMKIQATFQYVKGQYFEFNGDDDVWVFIDNKLVVDIGGQHQKIKKSINLDDLNLVEDSTYNFHIFYAERKREESNFMMRTSIDLHVESSMFLKDGPLASSEIIQKDVWQKVKERVLACDFSSEPEKETTELGPSNFVLFGRSLDSKGIPLNVLDSVYYGGIQISNDYTQLTIDPKTLSKMNLLPPGTYFVRVSLKNNPNDYKDVYFTVDPTELPNIAFARVKDSSYCILDVESEEGDSLCYSQYWEPLGTDSTWNVSSDTLPVNLNLNEKLWAGRSYQVNVMYAEEWASRYSGVSVKITMSDPLLVACDSMGNIIQEVVLDSGHAVFYIKGLGEVVNANMTLSTASSKNKSAVWSKISMKEPPVPQVELAYIFDRTGDGRADSLWIRFKKPLGGQSVLDSLKFVFGENFDKAYHVAYNDGDMEVSLVAEGDGFGSAIFTGGETKPYNGRVDIWYTYTDPENGETAVFPVEGVLTDKVGPVIIAAEVKYLKDGNTQLTLNFSEGVDGENAEVELFRFHCWKSDVQDSVVKAAGDIGTIPANNWKLIFPKGSDADIIPAVGDSVRFRPRSQLGEAKDLLGVEPHEKNPWVRITGELKVTVTSPKIVSLTKDDPELFARAREIIQSEKATVPKLVGGDKILSADQVAGIYGTQGHYLGDLDMAALVENEIAEIVKAVQEVYTDKNGPVNEDGSPTRTYSIEEIVQLVSEGSMTIGEAKKRFGLSPVVVDAYNKGLLTSENVHFYAVGTDEAIQKIVSAIADKAELRYEAIYYTSLGHYVNSHSGTITCNSEIFQEDGSKNCLESEGRLFLAWNMRADNGRLAATGVYIARLNVRIKVNSKVIMDRTQDFLWGVRRGDVNAIDLGL